jgi:hypothetical protein
MDAFLAPCLDLKLVCRDTRFAGYQQWPPGLPQERLRTHRWGQIFGTPLSYSDNFYLGSYLFRSLAAQGPKKITEKYHVHSGPLGGITRGLGMTIT